jgi:hypothetical protein
MSRLAFCHVFLDIRITHNGLFAYHIHSEKTIVVIPELLGHKAGKQDSSMPVPGGFITWLAWEIVPEVQLGDATIPPYSALGIPPSEKSMQLY